MNAGEYVLENTATCYVAHSGQVWSFGTCIRKGGWFYVDWEDQDTGRVGPFTKWLEAADAAEAAGFLRPRKEDRHR